MITFAQRSRSRISKFSVRRPSDWRPSEVVNPNGGLMSHFTHQTAWEFIASRLAAGEEVKVIELQKPPGKKGYVMNIDLGSALPRLYVKLEMGSSRVFGRSFHYSKNE